jgi:hypothetical protein
MLAEARGYRLSMVLAHQHLGQLPRELRDAVSANARTKVFFSMSPEDAHVLARHVAPEVSEHDLSHLGAYVAAARLVVGGEETPAFTLTTRPAPPPEPGRAEAVRAANREVHRRPDPKEATPLSGRAFPAKTTGAPAASGAEDERQPGPGDRGSTAEGATVSAIAAARAARDERHARRQAGDGRPGPGLHQGLHEGLHNGLRQGLRPGLEPSGPGVPPAPGGGEGSAVTADSRGRGS